MRFSLGLPTCMEGIMYRIPFASPGQLIEIATLAEDLGFYAVWGNDHSSTPRYVREEFITPPNFWEVLTTLSVIAASTSNLHIGTGVLVPALRRDIVVLAKQLVTLDHLSKGRLILGIGIGAYREEFESLHPEWKVNRGAVLEEFIHALQLLFEERVASWNGEYFCFKDVELFPKPFQKPLPIYIGGNNPNAIERSALFGHGWMGAGMPIVQFTDAIQDLHDQAVRSGRNPDDIDIAPQLSVCIEPTFEVARKKYRSSPMYQHLLSLGKSTLISQINSGTNIEELDLIGTSASISEKIELYRRIGITHIAGILFIADNINEQKEKMHQFAEEVMVNFR